MSDERNDGGPAFPGHPPAITHMARRIYGDGGMSLRDYFAAQAMFGLLAQPNFHPIHNAAYCYEVADAMLEARGA